MENRPDSPKFPEGRGYDPRLGVWKPLSEFGKPYTPSERRRVIFNMLPYILLPWVIAGVLISVIILKLITHEN